MLWPRNGRVGATSWQYCHSFLLIHSRQPRERDSLSPRPMEEHSPGPLTQSCGESCGETKSSVTRRLPTRSTNERRVRAPPTVAEHTGARNSTAGAVLQGIMRLGTYIWARMALRWRMVWAGVGGFQKSVFTHFVAADQQTERARREANKSRPLLIRS